MSSCCCVICILMQEMDERTAHDFRQPKMDRYINYHTHDEDYYQAKTRDSYLDRLLFKTLHVFVFSYNLLGIIRLNIKFTHLQNVVRKISACVMYHSWYMTVKFFLISLAGYIVNSNSYVRQLQLDKFNCSNLSAVMSNITTNSTTMPIALKVAAKQSNMHQLSPIEDFGLWVKMALLSAIDPAVGNILLSGNGATVMYGFYSVSFYIMLALFSTELCYKRIDFNYTRFVLCDTSYLKELYRRRQIHMSRLRNLAQDDYCSLLGLSIKKTVNQFPLDVCIELNLPAPTRPYIRLTTTTPANKNQPSNDISLVANENLMLFQPFVRSRHWLKLSRQVYMILILYHFSSIMLIWVAIVSSVNCRTKILDGICGSNLDWYLFELLTFLEIKYSMVVLSVAASHYCSYFFATIIELIVWIEELDQQLKLCQQLVTANSFDPLKTHSIELHSIHQIINSIKSRQEQSTFNLRIEHWLDQLATESLNEFNLIKRRILEHKLGDVDKYYNQFGGVRTVRERLKFNMASQSMRFRRLEAMANKLAFNRPTILRATYLNLNLFLDEFKATRYMMITILKRSSLIIFGFVLLVAITKTQFDPNYRTLRYLLIVSAVTINFYLVCAATINCKVSTRS